MSVFAVIEVYSIDDSKKSVVNNRKENATRCAVLINATMKNGRRGPIFESSHNVPVGTTQLIKIHATFHPLNHIKAVFFY